MLTYKRPVLLRRAIKRVLGQTYPHFILHIYDDASGDETSKVVDEFAQKDSRIIYHCNEKNLGAVLNCAQAMEQISTPFFTFCADDDVLLPQHIEFAMEEFNKHPQAAIVCNQTICMDEQRRILHINHMDSKAGLYDSAEGVRFLLKDPGILAGVVARKEILESGITLDKDTGMLWDWDFCFQALAKFPSVVTKKQGSIFVTHSSSFFVALLDNYEWPGWLKMYRKIVAHPNLDEATKGEVELHLKKRLRSLMVKQGKEAILNKNFPLADLSAQPLRDFFGSPRHYLKIKILALLCKLFPPYRWLLIFVRKIRSKKKVFKGSIRYQKYQGYEKYLDI